MVQSITDDVCVARIGKNNLIAFDRKCPHDGGDLALDTVSDGAISCPWHILRFDPETGASACKSLTRVRRYDDSQERDIVTVDLGKEMAVASAS